MKIDIYAAHAIRDAVNEAASQTEANAVTLMATLVLMASHMAHKHCGTDVARQDQWFRDFVTGAKLQLEDEGRRHAG